MRESLKKVHVIGIDASGPCHLPDYLHQFIFEAEQIIAPTRILEIFPKWWSENNPHLSIPHLISSDKPNQIIDQIKNFDKKTILLSSGDPLWFGIGRVLIDKFGKENFIFHPSPTSLQLAFARLGRPWQDSCWASLHGRDTSYLEKLIKKRPTSIAILTDPNNGGVKVIQDCLNSFGLLDIYEFWIFERLGHNDENFRRINHEKNSLDNIDPLNIVVLIKDEDIKLKKLQLPLFGIEDGLYKQQIDRPNLMTKREIRVQILAELNLPVEGVIWDIGAGVGTIGLESIRIRPKLKLMCVDKRFGCTDVIRTNSERLSVKPEKIYEKDFLDLHNKNLIPKSLKNPDRVIIGGGGSQRSEIVNMIIPLLNSGGIIVIPLSTFQAVNEVLEILRSNSLTTKLSQHQNYRGISIGKGTRLSPTNPVFILQGIKS